MDGEDLIICVALWTLYKRRSPLPCDDLRAVSIASRNKLRSASLCGAIFRDFGAILKGFGRPKWMPKPIFWRLLFDVFFECVFAWIFGCCLEARNLKNHKKTICFSMFFVNFHDIDVCEQISKHVEFGLHFRRAKRRKFNEKWYAEILFFSTSNFENCFPDFSKICSIWGGAGASKN